MQHLHGPLQLTEHNSSVNIHNSPVSHIGSGISNFKKKKQTQSCQSVEAMAFQIAVTRETNQTLNFLVEASSKDCQQPAEQLALFCRPMI